MIRSAVRTDLPAILALERAAATAPHWSEADYRAILATQSPPRCLLVAQGEREFVVGFAVGAVVAGEGELESVVVAPEAQGRGIGRALCSSVIDWCRDHKVEHVRLEVRVGSAGAIHLYHSLGFLPVGRRPAYYNGPIEDALLMLCRLG